MSEGGLVLVTTMLTSTHTLMVNEALVSLAQLVARLLEKGEEKDREDIHAHLHTDLVINGVKNTLTSKTHPKEVKFNALTLTNVLLKVKTEEFRQMLKDMRLVEEALDPAEDEVKAVKAYGEIVQAITE